MQKQPPSSFCARAAIAAALALGSTAAFAQDVAPAPDIPTVAPPAPAAAAPAPQVITQSNPIVQQVPATPEPVAAPAQTVPARTAARAQPAPRVPARAAPSAAAVPVAAPIAAAPIVAPPPVPVAQTPLAEPAPIPATEPQLADDGLTGAEAGMLALLAAAGLAGAGLLVARSRRKRSDEVEDYEPATTVLAPEPDAVFVREPTLERFAQPASPAPTPAPAMAGPVPAGDARQALLERMVAAEPDDENPFVSRKRRVRRARMILAQREQGTQTAEQFDWRTYRPSVTNPRVREEVPEPSTV